MKSLSAWAIIHRIRDEDKHPFLAVVLTTISAMAASVGGAVVVFCYKPSPTALGVLLAFSAGIMLYVTAWRRVKGRFRTWTSWSTRSTIWE